MNQDTRGNPRAPERSPGPGLKLRLWVGCLAGGLLAGLGTLWVLGMHAPAGSEAVPALIGWLSGVGFGALTLGLVLALWLDHHVVGHLRGLLTGARTGRVAELRGLPAAAGWGELSDLGEALQDLLQRQRQSARAQAQLDQQRVQLEALRAAIETWQHTETWTAPAIADGDLAGIAERLGHALQRRATVDHQNREVARQVAGELGASLEDAQESAEQAERGFVEATALLTTVRELQRLSQELAGALAAADSAPPPPSGPSPGEAARVALEELVRATSGSVESLATGMLRVQDVADQVQRLANRSTLIAIQAIAEGTDPALAGELKQLAKDVREATDRTVRYAMDIETAVAEAGERMRNAREGTLARLEATLSPQDPAAPASAPRPGRALDDAGRLLERVREMVQDAARKGERLSAAGERASRAAERLARRLDGGAAEAEALAVRLSPAGEAPATPSAPDPADSPSPDLRLLPRDDGDHSDDASHEEGRP